jgi:RNA methyltransferase, TrmH family
MNPLAFNNQEVQRLRRLIGRRSFRVSEQAFVVEGPKVLGEALDSGALVDSVFVEVGWDHDVLARLSPSVRRFAFDRQTLERVADTTSPQGVLAVLRRETPELDSLRTSVLDGGFLVVASALQDPGNCGTIIRSAEGAGACGVVLCDHSVDPASPKALRSTAGAFFHVPVVEYGSIADLVEELQSWGVRCFATSSVLEGGVPPDSVDLTGPVAIVLGNEAKGLDPAILGRADGLLTIPTVGRTESLNVAMSATLIAFEAARQRRSPFPRSH